ncbi:MAG TPA: hypothetical protein VEK79_14710 [Thermoanaerobaculia bacterium]|nr:hypothetical protein [Thermoanaerobaculia bacterium]
MMATGFGAAVFALAFLSCADVSASAQQQDGGIRRDSLAWDEKHFGEAGVKFEAPAPLCAERESVTSFSIGIHSVEPPAGVHDDTTCIVTIAGDRMTSDAFEQQQKSLRMVVPDDPVQRRLREWLSAFHDTIDRIDNKDYANYRYDLRCTNGDVLRASAEVLHVYQNGVSVHDAEDEKTVRRILGSLKCVERGY